MAGEDADATLMKTGPMSAIELLRVGTALVPYGLAYSNEVWIAMAMSAPHEVALVTDERTAALSAVRLRGGDFRVYGPFAPPPVADYEPELDEVDPSPHNWTNMFKAQVISGTARNGARLHSVTKVTLSIQFDSDPASTVVYDCGARCDAIAITQAAREAFMYPRYSSIFGTKHVSEMRTRLGD